MIEEKEWRIFRDKLRDIRMTGKSIKYIGDGKQNLVTGVPVAGDRVFVGDRSFGNKSFMNTLHMETSFSVDGVLMSNR